METLPLTITWSIDFEISTTEASAITDQEILDSILINSCAEQEEEKSQNFSRLHMQIELLECWSLFDNSGSEIRRSLILVSKRFD